MRRFGIFLASPGDVTEERRLAGEVIEQLRHERRFRDELNLQKIAWDQPGQAIALPMGMTPQQAISWGLAQPCECDLVLVLLWSRMGTPLPAEYVKPDGTPYLSGTEWEYWNAMQAFRAHGKPSIWMYRRTAPPPATLNDPDLPEKHEQWARLQSFLGMIRNPDGSIAHGVNHYDDPASFRRQFEAHLRDELDRFLFTAQSQVSRPTVKHAVAPPPGPHANSQSPQPPIPTQPEPLVPEALLDEWQKQLSDPDEMPPFAGPWCEALVKKLNTQFPSDAAVLLEPKSVFECFRRAPVGSVGKLFAAIRYANDKVPNLRADPAVKWAIALTCYSAVRCFDLARWPALQQVGVDALSEYARIGDLPTRSTLLASVGIAGLLGYVVRLSPGGMPDGTHELTDEASQDTFEQAILRQLHDRLLCDEKDRRVNPDNRIDETQADALRQRIREMRDRGDHVMVVIRVPAVTTAPGDVVLQALAHAINATVIRAGQSDSGDLIFGESGYRLGELHEEIKNRFAQYAPEKPIVVDAQRGSGKDRVGVAAGPSQPDIPLHGYEWHLFISHASEDKPGFVLPLCEALRGLGLRVWLDREQARTGDVLPEKVRHGLARSRFGVVVASARYFEKSWTVAELNALISRHQSERRTIIYPIRLGLSHDEVVAHNPLLGNLISLDGADGVARIAKELRTMVAIP